MDSAIDADRVLAATFVCAVEHHPVIDSTNSRAKRLARSDRPQTPLLVVADTQTAGRGRGSNRWWTGRGNLACSLLLDSRWLKLSSADVPLVSLATAVSVVRTAEPLLAEAAPKLHWPNDVYVSQRKLAGVLVEIVSGAYCVIGIGMNVNCSMEEAPEEVRKKATSLFQLTGRQHAVTDLLIELLGHLESSLHQVQSDPVALAMCANRLCGQLGRRLVVRTEREVMEGKCLGIAADGALLLDTPAGQRRVISGVVLS